MNNRFHDDYQPPMPGGWHFWLDGEMIRGSSADDVFAKVKRYRENNAKHGGDAALETELWNYWCSLNPARCGLPAQPAAPIRREVPKEEWGRSLWMHMNHAAVNFDATYFLALCAGLSARLIPCEECRGHFSALMAELPPWHIASQREACEWVFEAHNRVNARLGKPIYAWGQAVADYGFPTK